jgi:hypothetical protein
MCVIKIEMNNLDVLSSTFCLTSLTSPLDVLSIRTSLDSSKPRRPSAPHKKKQKDNKHSTNIAHRIALAHVVIRLVSMGMTGRDEPGLVETRLET